MVDKDWTFVLGAQDPEMREIKKAISHAGSRHVHAAKAGVRCNPRTAYEADGVILTGPATSGRAAVLAPQTPAVFVECTLRGHEPVLRVDHHHPGDAGYDKAPEDYMEGSSLGQVLTHLEMEPTETQRLLAAGDHCLTAAYQGMCPGVDPNELLFLRASWKAWITGRSFGDVMDGILDSVKRVETDYDSEYGESVFLDPTEVPPDLAEGAAYAGKPIRYREWFRDGELKEMLKGAGPEHIERFMQDQQQAGREVYGNPYRGYAGAYIP